MASIATVAGVSYAHVKSSAKALNLITDDPRSWFEPRHIRALLAHYGIEADPAEIPFTCWGDLPDEALLAIKWRIEGGQPVWHWVAFARDDGGMRVLDPNTALQRHVRTDFGRMKPKWYMRIRTKTSGASALGLQ